MPTSTLPTCCVCVCGEGGWWDGSSVPFHVGGLIDHDLQAAVMYEDAGRVDVRCIGFWNADQDAFNTTVVIPIYLHKS